MSLPKVVIAFGNGNLLLDVDAVDGICGLVGTGHTSGLLGTPMTVYNMDDAIAQGITLTAEADAYRHVKEFYDELGGNQELHILLLANTVTMAQMLDNTNASGAKKLVAAAGGKIRKLGVFRKPVGGYNPGTDFIDADVAAAVSAAKTFGDARRAEQAFLRIIIEGRVADDTQSAIYSPKTADNGYAGVVLGGSGNDGSASIGAVLGRCSKYPCHIKPGKVANGALRLTACYIGSKALKDIVNLETLHDLGYISFLTYPQKAGFFIGKDHMASIDDYRYLTNGCVVDKAGVITAVVCTELIEGELDVDLNGNISELDINHIKGLITQQINVGMAEQISTLEVTINPTQNIINTGKLAVKESITPKGYASEIDVNIALNAPAL